MLLLTKLKEKKNMVVNMMDGLIFNKKKGRKLIDCYFSLKKGRKNMVANMTDRLMDLI